MNKIEWNKVTWYSKLGALILFLLIVPALTFYMGIQYERASYYSNFPTFYIPVQLPNAVFEPADQMSESLSDTDIDNAIVTSNQLKGNSVQKIADKKFQMFDGRGELNVDIVAKGDLNADGFEDAIIKSLWCAASCGSDFVMVINQTGREGVTQASRLATYSFTPEGIETAGYKQATIKTIAIAPDGVVSITANNGTKDEVFKYKAVESLTNSTYSLKRVI